MNSPVRHFHDPLQMICVVPGEDFAIELGSSPTTGYTWEARADPAYLDLVLQAFEPDTAAIGAGGREVFCFRARQTGEIEISFERKRPWSTEVCDRKSFRVWIR